MAYVKKQEKLRVPFELKVLGIIHRVSILHCEVEVFPVFYLSGVNFGMSFLVESQIQMGRHPLPSPNLGLEKFSQLKIVFDPKMQNILPNLK